MKYPFSLLWRHALQLANDYFRCLFPLGALCAASYTFCRVSSPRSCNHFRHTPGMCCSPLLCSPLPNWHKKKARRSKDYETRRLISHFSVTLYYIKISIKILRSYEPYLDMAYLITLLNTIPLLTSHIPWKSYKRWWEKTPVATITYSE